ncbi:hypothetical protein NYZ99_10000 [Maribacter litopenaei]|uniref:Uncharacterized protein n=1 Tax=Maribacter litopenaei TaxID=2976127 RepID=A0ABY5YCB8_9FLAO|nr:hypothetical protein [Maribacter litopenaei]UWX56481.1 hypothetical protein NYZ99_10000 [Maribacter litopenaei]
MAINESVRLDNEVIFRRLVLFLRGKLYSARSKGSLSTYTALLILPLRLYPYINQKYRNFLIDLLGINYREIAISTSIIIKRGEHIDFEKQLAFLETNYWGCIQLMKLMIDAKDYSNFTKIFDEINQITSSFSISEVDEERSDSMRKALFIHRSFYFILLSWIIYLYHRNKIDFTNLKEFDIQTNILNEFNFYRNIEFYEFFGQLRQKVFHQFLEIENWEIEQHKPGKAYFALSSRVWLNFGFIFFLLKNPSFSSIINFERPIEIESDIYSYLSDDVQDIFISIEKDLSDKWGKILYPSSSKTNIEENFKVSKDNIVGSLSELKKIGELNHYKFISEQPLSEKKIENFIGEVGEKWERSNLIPSILKTFDCVEYRENNKELDFFGHFRLYSKMKSMFTEEGHKMVYGVNDVGAISARNLEGLFFNKLNEAKHNLETENLKIKLDELINNFYPDRDQLLIFMNWKAIELLNAENEIQFLGNAEDKFITAKYRSISVVRNLSFFNDSLLIIDLKKAINFIIYQDKNWFHNELFVDVLELSEEVIEDEMTKFDTKWRNSEGYEVTKDQALLLIKSSVLIKVLVKFELEIKNKDFYHFLKF